MNTVTQNLDTRPSEIPPPPASERKPRRKRRGRKAASASVIESISAVPDAARANEEWHQKRVGARLAQEQRVRDEQTRDYDAVCVDEHVPLKARSAAGLLGFAIGTCEPDPVIALLQELTRRVRTLRAAVCLSDQRMWTLTDDDLDMELYMLERRAEVAQELLERGWVRRSADESETVLDHAAEE